MKFLDLFAGIGGARLGLEQAGMECVGHVEWDRFARQSYQAIHSYGREEEYGKEFEGHDISKVKASELPRADLWVFGAPCQDFSFAGKRQGLAGDRSSLVGEVFRLVRETEERNRPEWLVYENVKGMLSSNGGRDFLQILISFDELGYDCEWQILNTKACGDAPPQNRERVYTIGHLRSRGRRTILPIQRAYSTADNEEITMKSIGNTNPSNRGMNGEVFSSDGLAPTINTNKGEGQKIAIRQEDMPSWIPTEGDINRTLRSGGRSSLSAKHNYDVVAIKQIGQYDSPTRQNSQRCRVYDQDGLAPTLGTCSGGNLQPMIVDDLYKNRPQREYEDYSPTLRSGNHGLKVAFTDQSKHDEHKPENLLDTLASMEKVSKRHVAIAASRGRNPENPSDRTKGALTEQRLEINKDKTSNTLTSAQKDNLVVEKIESVPTPAQKDNLLFVGGIGDSDRVGDGKKLSRNFPQGNRVYDSEGMAATLQAEPVGGAGGSSSLYKVADPAFLTPNNWNHKAGDGVETRKRNVSKTHPTLQANPGSTQATYLRDTAYRVRKLTPKECWRLQGFPDYCIERAIKAGVSDSQLYKQAGNAISVNVAYVVGKAIMDEMKNEAGEA